MKPDTASFLLLALLAAAPAHAEEHIVDDSDGSPWFTTSGDDWTTWGTNGYGYDSSDSSYHYLSHTVGGDDRRGTATWQAELQQAGTWHIETWFRRTENRTHDADHVVTDGLGVETWISIDQEGEGASDWVSLGEYWCEDGFGGCVVTLDGTDDDDSDEANAMRFTLVSTDDTSTEIEPCSEVPEPGTHLVDFSASSASGSGWESAFNATAEADGDEAESPNVDAGEVLQATGFDICDPRGEETIDNVTLAVKARTQYDSGTYALQLLLDAGGSASTVFTGTTSTWHEADISEDQDWTWTELAELRAQVSLYDHPGGARDSDAWVDAFRLRVTYSTASGTSHDTGSLEETGGDDTGVSGGSGSDTSNTGTAGEEVPDTGRESGDEGRAPSYSARTGCNASGAVSTGFAWLGLLFFTGLRERRG